MDKTDYVLNVDIATDLVPTWKGDALIIGIFESGEAQPALAQCGPVVENEVKKYITDKWIAGKMGETYSFSMPAKSDMHFKRVILLGLGKKESLTEESFRTLGGHIRNLCFLPGITTCFALVTLDSYKTDPGKEKTDAHKIRALDALAEGAWLSNYRFEQFKSGDPKESKEKREEREKEKATPRKLFLGYSKERLSKELKRDPKKGGRLAEVESLTRGVAFARELGNQPGNRLNPETLAQEARKLAERLPAIKTTVYAEKTLASKGMNGILAVGSGSITPPRLITMEYRHGGNRPILAVVGKGITFDSGGISLKPGGGMEEMKFDMCGAAAVFGFIQAVAEIKLPVNIVGIVPTAENMPSATAQRPGDIIKMAKGVFVEVVNTDAEGRLILADALHHAASFKPEAIIDLATLTGACVVALGSHVSGLMGNNSALLRKLEKAGEASGDRVWRLPLYPEYQEQINSTVADIKNVGGKGAGTITSACFLSRFVDADQAWAHLDIAGTAWDMGSARPHVPKGAVGVGVRLLYRFVLDYWL